jgi:stage III sporulation protein AE
MKRLFVFLIYLAVLFALFTVHTAAEETMPPDYDNFLGAIPDDVAGLLPDGFFSGDADKVASAVGEAAGVDSLIDMAINALSGGMGSALSLFASLVVLLALCVLVGASGESLSGSLSGGASFISSLAVAASVVGLQYGRFEAVGAYFANLRTIMTSLVPVMSMLYLSGGNVSNAAVTNTTFVLCLDLIGILVTGLLMPAATVCLAIAMADSLQIGKAPSLSGVADMIKKVITFVFGLASTLFAASMGVQSVLAASSDSVGARAVKYVAGNMIPVLGSTVADSLRTVAASTKLLRSTVGVAGIVVLGALLLPTLVSLWLTRLSLFAAAAVGDMLGCSREVVLLRQVASIYGYLLGAAAMTALLFVFALTVFAVTSSAAGGI